ncbi:MarR family winged helix-turn-helix transcriptional regulator [Thermosipho ferrireducens]|nr:MarR family transcriptional regulator [Thermosipho ferrireducens]
MNFSQIFVLLTELEKIKFQILRNEMKNYGVHPGQIPLLFIVNKNPGISQTEISEKIHVNPSTVAIMIRRMEKHGLIQRKRSEKDRREFQVFLTEKSKELITKIYEKMKDFEEVSLKNFSKEEIENFEALLKKMIINLEAIKNDENF